MTYTATGKVKRISDVQKISDAFQKRSLILEISDLKFPQVCEFEFTQERVGLLDSYQSGDEVVVEFNLRGREYTKDGNVRYFNTLDGWKIQNNLKSAVDKIEKKFEAAKDDLPF